jgi:predicted dehydrogenase
MEQKKIIIGIVGLGKIGMTHAEAYRQVETAMPGEPFCPSVRAVLRSHPGGDEDFLASVGSPRVFTDLDDFLAQPLDMVDICTPNFMHYAQIEAALRKGFNVYCEKPLAMDAVEGRRLAELARKAGVLTHMAFVFRYFPHFRKMAELVAGGEIGRPNHFRFNMFHSGYLNTERPYTWRLNRAASGGGALADLGSHVIDLVHYIVGDTAWVQAETRTFVNDRPVPGENRREKVDVDDWAVLTLGLKNGAVGTLEVSRLAGGMPHDNRVEVYGSKGSLVGDFNDPRHVRLFSQSTGEWRTLEVVDSEPGLPLRSAWQKGSTYEEFFITSHLASVYEFLGCLQSGKRSSMDMDAGQRVQEVQDAAYSSSAHGGARIDLAG